MGGLAEAEGSVGGVWEAGGERSPPATVTFPDAARRNLSSIPPIKLEAEDTADEATPHTMWQLMALHRLHLGGMIISGNHTGTYTCMRMRAHAATSTHAFVYILGGFLVLRWVWARWKERKDKGRAPDDPSS